MEWLVHNKYSYENWCYFSVRENSIGHDKTMSLRRAPESVLRGESKQPAEQVEKSKERKRNQPIELQEKNVRIKTE